MIRCHIGHFSRINMLCDADTSQEIVVRLICHKIIGEHIHLSFKIKTHHEGQLGITS
jgi:hypothetical protein